MLRHGWITPLVFTALAISAGSLTARQGGSVYRDPAGRFAVRVPAGWKTTALENGVGFSRGAANAVVSPFQGARSGQAIVEGLSRQYASQWQNFTGINRGDFRLAGQPAAYAMFSGINPKGVPALLRIAGVVRGNEGYVIIISAPQSEFNAISGALEALESSFSLAGGGGGGGGGAGPGSAPQGGGGGGVMGLGNAPGSGGPTGGPPAGGRVALGVGLRDALDNDGGRGAFIGQVQPGSAADRAGILPGDIVVSANDEPVNVAADLIRKLAASRPGDRIKLMLIRQGKSKTITVRLG